MTSEPIGVRPTKRCLADLGAELPDLGVPLEEIDHPIVVNAQSVPAQRDAGGAERIVAISDRVWFKVKTSDLRAAVTELRGEELPDWARPSRGAWWIGTAGRRQADSPQRDFYATLQRECTTGKTVSSEHLLPADWDWERLAAEQAVAWRRAMKRMVVRLVAMSLKNGHLSVAEFRNHRIKALVRADNGHEAYLAIIAEGVPDPQMFALLLDCVPGVGLRKKSSRDRRAPTMSNAPMIAFPQARPCFPASINDHRDQPKPRVIVPLQRLTLEARSDEGASPGRRALA